MGFYPIPFTPRSYRSVFLSFSFFLFCGTNEKKNSIQKEVWARDGPSLSTTTSLPTCWIFRSKCFRVSIKCTTLENSHKHDTCEYVSCLQKGWPQGWDNVRWNRPSMAHSTLEHVELHRVNRPGWAHFHVGMCVIL